MPTSYLRQAGDLINLSLTRYISWFDLFPVSAKQVTLKKLIFQLHLSMPMEGIQACRESTSKQKE